MQENKMEHGHQNGEEEVTRTGTLCQKCYHEYIIANSPVYHIAEMNISVCLHFSLFIFKSISLLRFVLAQVDVLN